MSREPVKSSAYSILWPLKLPKLPSVESFQLNKILDDLSQESSEVSDAVIDVAANYKKDLKLEIRRKLHTEQKIQSHNIMIAKSTNQLNKRIRSTNRKVEKLIGSKELDNDLEGLVGMAVECSDLIGKLVPKLKRIEQEVGLNEYSKYPTISKLWADRSPPDRDISNPTQSIRTPERPSPEVESRVQPPSISSGVPSSAPTSTSSVPRKTSLCGSPTNEMDAFEFEQFMSSSIMKFRKLQSAKQQIQHFDIPDIILPDDMEKPQKPPAIQAVVPAGALSTGSPKFNSPLSLRLTSKSTATTLLTPQSTHFKKLRINGSPITTSTYQKMKVIPPCDCSESNHDHNDTAPLAPPMPSLRDSIQELNNLILNSEEDLHTNSSGGFTTDSDILSSGSSSSSDDDNDGMVDVLSADSLRPVTTMADLYYKSLKSNLESKRRRKKKELKKRAKIKNNRLSAASSNENFKAESSPTPKHKPSHYTLKPKKSILKLAQVRTKDAAKTSSSNQELKLVNNLEMNLKGTFQPTPPKHSLQSSASGSYSACKFGTGNGSHFFLLNPPKPAFVSPALNNANGTLISIESSDFDGDCDDDDENDEEDQEDQIGDNVSDTRSIRSIRRLREIYTSITDSRDTT